MPRNADLIVRIHCYERQNGSNDHSVGLKDLSCNGLILFFIFGCIRSGGLLIESVGNYIASIWSLDKRINPCIIIEHVLNSIVIIKKKKDKKNYIVIIRLTWKGQTHDSYLDLIIIDQLFRICMIMSFQVAMQTLSKR